MNSENQKLELRPLPLPAPTDPYVGPIKTQFFMDLVNAKTVSFNREWDWIKFDEGTPNEVSYTWLSNRRIARCVSGKSDEVLTWGYFDISSAFKLLKVRIGLEDESEKLCPCILCTYMRRRSDER